MRDTHTKMSSASSVLLLFPLAGLFAFTGKAPGDPGKLRSAIIVNDTPRIKFFSKVDVKKTTGSIKSVSVNEVKLFIINNRRYTSGELLYKFNDATLRADEMIVLPPTDENIPALYGTLGSRGGDRVQECDHHYPDGEC